MKLLTLMNRIKELDQEVAQVQKEDVNFDVLCRLFETTKKQANFMILYLRKCEKEGLDFEESQYLLEGYMLNNIEIGDKINDIVQEIHGVVKRIYFYDKDLWVQTEDNHHKLDDIELLE